MAVTIEGYDHQPGEHCASTALRNILRFHGTEISEGMVVGLAGGLGFYYLGGPGMSPSRMFHGRTLTLEQDFCRNVAIPFEEPEEEDDDRAWEVVREKLDRGLPVLLSTDTFYLGYQNTTSHFPGHRAVLVGYDDEQGTVQIADRKYPEYQVCSYQELRRARNADDYPMSCRNQYGDFQSDVELGRPLRDAAVIAMRSNADWMLMESADRMTGIGAMRRLAGDFASWRELEDWSWAARFGYQVVIKRGAGGSFFRSLYADFLRESEALLPALAERKMAAKMDAIAAGWRDLAGVLKQQSELERCEPELFERAGEQLGELAGHEEGFFEELRDLAAA